MNVLFFTFPEWITHSPDQLIMIVAHEILNVYSSDRFASTDKKPDGETNRDTI